MNIKIVIKSLIIKYFAHLTQSSDPSVKENQVFDTILFWFKYPWDINVPPYFKVLSFDKDITINPKFYADKVLWFRMSTDNLEKSDILSDLVFY